MFRCREVHGQLVYVLAHARAYALRDGVAFVTGPEGDQVSIAMVGDLWDVRPSSFFVPTWIGQVGAILNTHGLEATA